MIVQAAIHASSDFGSLRTVRRTSALQENDRHDSAIARVGVRGKPSVASSRIGARSSLPQNLLLCEVDAQRPCRPALNYLCHAIPHLTKSTGEPGPANPLSARDTNL